MWWDHDVGWAGWMMMTVGMVGFWVVIAVLVLAVVRSGRRSEIDRSEYYERLDALERVGR